MSDFRTVLIQPALIADITSEEVYGVEDGPAQSTYQQFQAVSSTNSQIVFNVQVPSENIVIDREVLLQSTLAFTITAGSVPVGQSVMQWGLDTALAQWPLQSLFTTVQATINNVSVNTNLQDVLPMLVRMYDRRCLSRYNSWTAAYPDCAYANYYDGILANNNPLASYNTSGYDEDLVPRGAFQGQSGASGLTVQIDRYVSGTFTDHSAISTNSSTNTWIISISNLTITEPLIALSPFTNCQPNCGAGLIGVNNMSMVLNVDSTCRRLISSAKNVAVAGSASSAGYYSGYITGVSLGIQPQGVTGQPIGFTNSRLLFNFLSLNPEQYGKIATKNVVPYLDYPRYLTTFNNSNAVVTGNTSTLTSQSIQLNQIPDLILICARVPMTSQNWNYSATFMAITGISVNFNNASGLLATATQQDLYRISQANGSSQSWHEFAGEAANNNNSTGGTTAIATSGSLLVLKPVHQFALPSYLSSSSLGQYQFQFNLTVFNQYPFSIQPEICIITVNSGLFITQQGTSQIYTGILTKQQVLDTKQRNPVPMLDTVTYKRLVGGSLQNMGMASVGHMLKQHGMRPQVMSGAGSSGGVMDAAMDMAGAGASGGGASGGGSSGGRRSRLSKHLM